MAQVISRALALSALQFVFIGVAYAQNGASGVVAAAQEHAPKAAGVIEAPGGAGVLTVLLMCALMGLVGQGARVVVGMKTLMDYKNFRGTQDDVFNLARLVFSLIVGFVVGLVGGMWWWQQHGIASIDIANFDFMVKFAVMGYIGADAIEAFTAKFFDKSLQAGAAGQKDAEAEAAKAAEAKKPEQAKQPPAAEFEARAHVADVKAAEPPQELALVGGDGATRYVTVAEVKQMFPATRVSSIAKYLPYVISGLRWADLTDKEMAIMALATIRAEVEDFIPQSEGRSKFNTIATPFDRYEPGTEIGHRLGNTEAGDGPRFKGRGFVQLTGRANYTHVGGQIHVDLVASPELANDPGIAGKILAQFLKNSEQPIRAALEEGDLKEARRLVNGGKNGLLNFEDAYRTGLRVIPA